jgi:hypothetical protein
LGELLNVKCNFRQFSQLTFDRLVTTQKTGVLVVNKDHQKQPATSSDLTTSDETIDMISVSQVLLKIVARWQKTQYTGDKVKKTVELEDDGPSYPASEITTSQG